jgi:integrase
MSPPRQPARLWLRPARGKRAAVWIIIDNRRQNSTGCGPSEHERAERALEAYIAKKRIDAALPRSAPADKVFVADVIRNYVSAKGTEVSRGEELAGRVERLLDWWGEKSLADVTRGNCDAYVKHRTTPGAARRELEDLRAAINLAIFEGVCRDAVKVKLPKKVKGRSRFLTRDETAKLLWSAWSFREVQKGVPTDKRPTRHIARFILTALYTSSRSARVWQASFVPEQGRPWVDLEHGLFFREAAHEQAADNKRAPPIRLPPRLLAHMRRWRASGARYVCEYQGRAADPKKAFRRVVARAGLADTAVVRHTFRHTSVTWLMQSGEDKWEVAGFAGMSIETLERTYGHHHPDHQANVGAAFSTGRAGRLKAKSA